MRRFFLLSAVILFTLDLASQEKSFEFYYIAHDRATPVNDLCKRLQYVYDHAIEYDNKAVIFYLPNYEMPLVVKLNLPDSNPEAFSSLIRELRNKSFHEVYADIDFRNIMSLLDEYDFIDDSGRRNWSSVLFCWYVNSEFWRFGYSEKIIAAVYFCCEFEKYRDYVNYQIWHPSGDGSETGERYQFDSKNLCSDLKIVPLPY